MSEYDQIKAEYYYKECKKNHLCVKCYKPLEPDVLGNYATMCPKCLSKRRKADAAPKKANTLCWNCAHSVPAVSVDGKRYEYGCEWSIKQEPVPGWDAEETEVRSQFNRYTPKMLRSYNVRRCPKFVKGGVRGRKPRKTG